jgi:hypothetical protein
MDGLPRVVGEVAPSGARECTPPLESSPYPNLPGRAVKYLCDPQCPLWSVLFLKEAPARR